MQRRQLLASALLAAALPVRAQPAGWPERPLRILVPGGPGGVTDIRARWIGQRLSAVLNQPVTVENRPGAGGNIGMEAGARSAPDGYTLVVVHQGTMTVNAHLYARTGYDPLTDFVPITRLGMGPLLLAVHPSVPAHSVRELVELGRSRPGSIACTSTCMPSWPRKRRGSGSARSAPNRATIHRRCLRARSASNTPSGAA